MFPLYSQLIKKEVEKDLTAQQKRTLVAKIEKMDQNAINLIFALISKYQSENEDACSLIPYNGKYTISEGLTNIQLDLENLPVKLKHIIYDFTVLCEKKD